MNLLLKPKRLIFLTFLASLLFSTCNNGAKERYLSAMNETLDREIVWIIEQIENKYSITSHIYTNNGSPLRMKEFYEKSDSIFNSFKSMNAQFNEDYNNRGNILEILEIKSRTLQKAETTYFRLNELYDSLLYYRGFELKHVGEYEIVSDPKQVIVAKGDSFKAQVMIAFKPSRAPSFAYKAYADGKLINTDKNGVAEYIISGDSTSKMKPGEYFWNAKVWVDFGNDDYEFTLKQSYKIIPKKCD